jgi:peptidylprolyl isomerase
MVTTARYFGQLFKIAGKMIWEDNTMKKSEKVKGKTAVTSYKKQKTLYAGAAAAVIIIMLVIGFYLFNPFVAKNGDTVMVYYTGMYENGTEFYSNFNDDPLIFTLGNKTMIPGFEEALIGMAPNTTKTVTIPFEKAYGPYRKDYVLVMNRSALPEDIEPVVGNYLSIQRKEDYAVAKVRITNVTSNTVTLDQNHLLAGQNVKFTIRFAGFYQK